MSEVPAKNPVATVPLWVMTFVLTIFAALLLWVGSAIIAVRDSSIVLGGKVEQLERKDARNEETYRKIIEINARIDGIEKSTNIIADNVKSLSAYIMESPKKERR